jgi:hypothetical protein
MWSTSLIYPPRSFHKITSGMEQEQQRGSFFFAVIGIGSTPPPPPLHPVSTASSLLGFHLSGCGEDAATKRRCAERKRDKTS